MSSKRQADSSPAHRISVEESGIFNFARAAARNNSRTIRVEEVEEAGLSPAAKSQKEAASVIRPSPAKPAQETSRANRWWDRLQAGPKREKDKLKYVDSQQQRPQTLRGRSASTMRASSPERLTVSTNLKKQEKIVSLLRKRAESVRNSPNLRKQNNLAKQDQLLDRLQMEKVKKQEQEILRKDLEHGERRLSKVQSDKRLTENVQAQNKMRQEQEIQRIYEQERKKLRKDLDLVNETVQQKMEHLQKLRAELAQVSDIQARESKFDNLLTLQQKEADKRSLPPKGNQPPGRATSKLNADIMSQSSASHSQTQPSQRNSQSQRSRQSQRARPKAAGRPSSAKNSASKINLDDGISNALYKPTALLARKAYLFGKLEQSKQRFEHESLDHNSYKYMLERLQGQQGYEVAMIRELDPYFQFQSKIVTTLESISQGKEARIKIQDQKVKQIKTQMREKKAGMAQHLRQMCLVLVELERENKKAKSRMLGAATQNQGNSSTKDTRSVGGTTVNTSAIDPIDKLQLKSNNNLKESLVINSAEELGQALPSIREDPEETDRKIEIDLSNCEQMHTFIDQAQATKFLFLAQRELKLSESSNTNSEMLKRLQQEIMTDTREQILNVLKGNMKQKEKLGIEQREQLIQLRMHLSQKPPKSMVSFADKARGKAAATLDNASHAKLDKVAKWHERQQEAKQMFYDVKEAMESIMLESSWVTETFQSKLDRSKLAAKKVEKNNLDIISEQDSHSRSRSAYPQSPRRTQEQKRDPNTPTVNLEINVVNFPKEELAPSEMSSVKNRVNVPSLELTMSRGLGNVVSDSLNGVLREAKRHAPDTTQEKPTVPETEFELFCKLINSKEEIIKRHNDAMTNDTIMQIDYNDMNENKVKNQILLKKLQKELDQHKEAKKANELYKLDREDAHSEDLDTERQEQIAEDELFEMIINKKRVGDKTSTKSATSSPQHESELAKGQGSSNTHFSGDQGADDVIRKVMTGKEILQKNVINLFDIEQMQNDHLHFQMLTVEVRSTQEKIRLQCNEFINAFAYRINLIIDVAEIDFLDSEIEKIIKIYKRNWPYEPLILESQEDSQNNTQAGGQSELMLKNLAKLENVGNLKSKAKQKKEQKAKRKQMEEGLNDFQIQMRQSSIWCAFAEKIERGLLFLHLRKFIKFLSRQVKVLRKPTVAAAQSLAASGKKTPKKINPNRKAPQGEHFELEYKNFLQTNQQNMKQIQNQERVNAETPQEQVQLQQQIMLEDIHFADLYKKNHVHHNKKSTDSISKQSLLQMKRVKTVFNSSANLYEKQGGIEKILRQVNQDKCNYSRLLSYELQDIDFIQQFMARANVVQASEILAVATQNEEPKKGKRGIKSSASEASPNKTTKSTKSWKSQAAVEVPKPNNTSSRTSLKPPIHVKHQKSSPNSKFRLSHNSSMSKTLLGSGRKTYTTLPAARLHQIASTTSAEADGTEDGKAVNQIPQLKIRKKKRPQSSYFQIEERLKERSTALQEFYRSTSKKNEDIKRLRPHRSQQDFKINRKRLISAKGRSTEYVNLKREAIGNLEGSSRLLLQPSSCRSGMTNLDLPSCGMNEIKQHSTYQVRNKGQEWYFASSDEDAVDKRHLQWFETQKAVLEEDLNVNAAFELSRDDYSPFPESFQPHIADQLIDQDSIARSTLNEDLNPIFLAEQFLTDRYPNQLPQKEPAASKIKIKKVKLPRLQQNKTLNKLVMKL